MKLSHLTDEELDRSALKAVRLETDATANVLHHLNEVDRRRLFSNHGFDSLFTYATKFLGYSEDAAARRISAMRLLREIPEIEPKIQEGALTLSHLNKAQSMFRREQKAQRPRAVSEKLEVLSRIERLPIREVEKTLELETYVPQPTKSIEPISLEQFGDRVRKKLERLLEVRSHSIDGSELEKLIEQMADLALEKWDPLVKAERARAKHRNDASRPATSRVNTRAEGSSSTSRAPIPAATRHAVYLRDSGRCGNCGSSKKIQIDHIIPVALGGRNDLSNLRLLCRPCNQRSAIESFGRQKMARYLRSPIQRYRWSRGHDGTAATTRRPPVKAPRCSS